LQRTRQSLHLPQGRGMRRSFETLFVKQEAC
jgi:hypothetical protein